MSWVLIDRDKCDDCGLCATRCLLCFSNKDGEITVNAGEATCSLCGHCVSLCPTGAIHHTRMNMDNFLPVDRTVRFDTDAFIHFIRTRRSHRHFKDRGIPRSHLETLVDACRYAPTGGNRQTVEIKIIQDPGKMKRFSDHTVDYFMSLYKKVEEQVAELKAAGKELPKDLRSMQANFSRYKYIGLARDLGLDVIFYKAPAVMLFHSPTYSTTPKDDCVIAAQTVAMLAMTMGLGTCYIGLFTVASNAHPPIAEELRLPPNHKVFSTLIVGYPKLKYLRSVDRKPAKVTWE